MRIQNAKPIVNDARRVNRVRSRRAVYGLFATVEMTLQ